MTESLLPAFDRLRDWSDDDLHVGRSVRHFEPVYKNPGALRRDVRALISAYENVVTAADALLAGPWPGPMEYTAIHHSRLMDLSKALDLVVTAE